MVLPIIALVSIPVFLGIVYVAPFDQPQEMQPEVQPEVMEKEFDGTFLYIFLLGIWSLFLIRIILQLKKGAFRLTQRY